MTTVKTTFITKDINGVRSYAIKFADGSYKHEQLANGISETQYLSAVKHTHKEYDFTPVIMTPPVEQAIHPHKEELDKSFGIEEVSFINKPPVAPNVDIATGEIIEDPQLKEESMKEAYNKLSGN